MYRFGLRSRKNGLLNFEHVELKIAKGQPNNYIQEEVGSITLNFRRCRLRTYVSM